MDVKFQSQVVFEIVGVCSIVTVSPINVNIVRVAPIGHCHTIDTIADVLLAFILTLTMVKT